MPVPTSEKKEAIRFCLRQFRKVEKIVVYTFLGSCYLYLSCQVTAALSKDKEPRPLWKYLSPLDHTVLFLFVSRKTGQALHATASQPRPHQHHQHRVVHDEEDGVRREDDDGEGLDVVGLDVGSQQEEQRRPPHTGTGIGILSTMLKGATLCGGNLCPPSHPLFTAWT